MNDRTMHPTDAEISAWIDGDLSSEAGVELENHVTSCSLCDGVARELRAIVRAAGELEDAPARDMWSVIAPQLQQPTNERRSFPWLVLSAGLAAGVLLMLTLNGLRSDGVPVHGERFMLLLHESPDNLADASPDEIRTVVESYRDWARELGRQGKLEAGEKLADEEGHWLKSQDGTTLVEPRSEPGGLGGFFIIRAASYDEALRLSRTCPHLGPNGWIELRRIENT